MSHLPERDGFMEVPFPASEIEEEPRAYRTMLLSTTCPSPLRSLSIRARRIPIAHVIPPPAKSASRFNGKVGFPDGEDGGIIWH